MPIQIGREMTPDADVRVYSSKALLTEQRCEVVMKGNAPSGGFLAELPMPGLNTDAGPVAAALVEIPGVAMVQVFSYKAAVSKAPTWEWSEIEPFILRLFGALNSSLERIEAQFEDKKG